VYPSLQLKVKISRLAKFGVRVLANEGLGGARGSETEAADMMEVFPPAPTDLAEFNEFQASAARFWEGHETADDLERYLATLDLQLGVLLGHFHEELAFQPASESLEKASELVYWQFDLLRMELPLVVRTARFNDFEASREHLHTCGESVRTLFEVLDTLKREDHDKGVYSDLPWVNELCRVATAVLTNRLQGEALVARLESARAIVNQLGRQFKSMQVAGLERRLWLASQPRLEGSLVAFEEGLEAFDRYLDDHQQDTLQAGLDAVCDAADALIEVYEQLQQQPPECLCPRCSAPNLPHALRCSSCGAAFPLGEEALEAPQISVRDEEGDELSLPQYIADLLEWLETGDAESALQQQKARFEAGLRQAEQWKELPELEEVHREALQAQRNRVRGATRQALEAVDELLEAVADQTSQDPGRAHLLEAVELLMTAYRSAAEYAP
jgi:hypothetical protein